MMKKIALLLGLAAMCFPLAEASAANKTIVNIKNQSGMRLTVYVLGRKMHGQVPLGIAKKFSLPIKVRQGVTYELMVVGGGTWMADRSGWTTLRNIRTCVKRRFSSKQRNVDWTITGRAKTCNGPVGYRQ